MYPAAASLSFVAFLLFAPHAAMAQDGADQPIVVEAEEALEWRRAEGAYIARGNARAEQGDLVVEADRLVAYEGSDAAASSTGAQLARMAAEGSVRITLPDAAATGDRADYDIDAGVIVLRGGALKLTTDSIVITARDALEYWPDRRLVVARGAARAVRGDDRIDADLLSAVLVADDSGGGGDQALQSVQGRGNVVLRTGGDIVRGDRATYTPQDETAIVTGNVRISRGEDVLSGGRAEVDFKAGTGRLTGGARGGGDDGRVKALFRVRDRGEGGS